MTDWLTIGIRFALYTNLMLLFGLPLFALYASEAGSMLRLRRVTIILAVAGIALSALSIAAMTASMVGVPIVDVDRVSLATMITDTPMGHAWAVRIVALAAIVVASVGRSSRAVHRLNAAGGAVALASLAWNGHGAAGENTVGTVQLIADVVHLWAAGAWLSALVALLSMLFRPVASMEAGHLETSHRALAGFSLIGSVIVGLIVATGLVNTYALVGPSHVLDLPFNLYGQLLIAKLTLFAAMLGLAAANRLRLTPALERAIGTGETNTAVGALRRSLMIEAGAAIAIIAVVALLGTLEPPMSM